jgi:hypothetical protein
MLLPQTSKALIDGSFRRECRRQNRERDVARATAAAVMHLLWIATAAAAMLLGMCVGHFY